MKCAKTNLISAVGSFAAGAICLTLAWRNGFKTLYLVAAGLSVLAGDIKLLDYFKARHTDEKSKKKGSE
ncbi:hypothetical protein [Oscillibacter sp.]|uniref:hypothetical protein n=1 Tax=Oscillibacter sp. TaxID=1945593 RepID=UPI0028A06CBA|nr:hypothetical protein [Oscillibacter sp.]